MGVAGVEVFELASTGCPCSSSRVESGVGVAVLELLDLDICVKSLGVNSEIFENHTKDQISIL